MRFYCGNCIILRRVESGGSMRMVNTMVITLKGMLKRAGFAKKEPACGQAGVVKTVHG